jgi:hypothetical protein
MLAGKALALNRLGEGSNPDSKCGADFNKYFAVVNPYPGIVTDTNAVGQSNRNAKLLMSNQ